MWEHPQRGRDLAVRPGVTTEKLRNLYKAGSGSTGTALGSSWVVCNGRSFIHEYLLNVRHFINIISLDPATTL